MRDAQRRGCSVQGNRGRSAYARAEVRPAVFALALALIALAAGACSGGAGGGDPASLVPADATFYAEASVRPAGGAEASGLAAAAKLLGTSAPARRLRELFDERLAKDFPGASWNRDFAPWVGDRIGVWADALGQSPASYAFIVPSDDQTAAKAALARLGRAARSHFTRQSFAGGGYSVNENGIAVGQIGDFVVIGTRDGFEKTAKGRDGEHLGDVRRYRDATGALDRSRLGLVYLDTRRVMAESVQRASTPTAQQLEELDALIGIRRMGPVAGALKADRDGLTVDIIATHMLDGPLRRLASSWWGGDAALMPALPADAWGAFAVPALGASTADVISSFARTLTGATLAAESRRSVRLDPQRDVLSWAGDVGGFVRDARTQEGAAVAEATDPRRAAMAMRRLAAAMRERSGQAGRRASVHGAEAAYALGNRWIVARKGERVVVAYGRAAAADALRPARTVGDDPRYAQARAALGGDMSPMVLLSNPQAVKLASDQGVSGSLRRYLMTFAIAAIGGKVEGHAVRLRIAARFRK